MFTSFSSMDTFDKISMVSFISAIVFAVVAFIVVWVAKKKAPDSVSAIKKGAIYLGVGYAFAMCVVLLFLTFDGMKQGGEIIPLIFYPILSGLAVAVGLAIAFLFLKILKPDKIELFKLIALGIALADFVAILVCLGVYYGRISEAGDGVSQVGLYIGAVAIIAVILGVTFVLGKKQKVKSDTKALAYGAISIALSFALSYVKIFRLPQGGSVTALSVLPLMIYSYMFGVRRGVPVAFIYGLLQALQDPWIIHPAQFLLDYPVAYMSIGLAGLFKEREILGKHPSVQFIVGGVCAGLIRYLCHALSGALAFASYAPDTFNPFAWGFLYNTFCLVDLALALAGGGLLLIGKGFRKVMDSQIQA